jgi:NAD(P)H-flavin reductase
VLQDIRDENVDVRTYRLEVRDGFARSGRPGQFNMLGYPGIGEAPISFSGLYENGRFEHTIRAVGLATRFMEHMQKGSEVLVRGPYGRGWPMAEARGKDLILLAGGVGLAPLRPVIAEVLKNRSDYGKVDILIGSRNEQGLLFTNEYAEWRKTMTVRITVDELVTGEPWNHQVGLITGLVDQVTLQADRTAVFICGPELMMRFTCKGLMLRGVRAPDLYVSLERRMKCGIAQCGHCQHVGLFVCKDGPVFAYREVAGLFDGLL